MLPAAPEDTPSQASAPAARPIRSRGSRYSALIPLALSDEVGTGSVLYMPSPRKALRHAAPVVIESVVIPLIAYYCALTIAGFRGALIGALAWSYALVVRRIIRHERVSTMLVLGTCLLTLRTVISVATGSVFLYFIQPTASAFLASGLLVGSALVGRPFTQRFTHDFCPLSPEFLARPNTHRFFVRVSFLWAATMFLNGVFVLVMLLSESSNAFAIERSAITVSLTFVAIFLSVVWFTRTMKSDGITVRFGTAKLPASMSSVA
jgi:intracellular septation protein A